MASRRSAPSGHVATTTTTQKWGSLFTWPKGPFSACHSHASGSCGCSQSVLPACGPGPCVVPWPCRSVVHRIDHVDPLIALSPRAASSRKLGPVGDAHIALQADDPLMVRPSACSDRDDPPDRPSQRGDRPHGRGCASAVRSCETRPEGLTAGARSAASRCQNRGDGVRFRASH